MDLQTGLVREALLYSNTEGRDAVQLLSDSLVLVYVPTQTTCSRLVMILSPKKIKNLLAAAVVYDMFVQQTGC